MGEAAAITLACVDLAGTTVADDGAVDTAFAEALATMGIVPGTSAFDRALSQVRDSRGRPDIDIFRQVFPGDEARARTADLAFRRAYDCVLDRVGLAAIPGAETALDKLTGAGLHVCLITGFGSRTMSRILDTLDWWKRADLAISADDIPRGRPWPDAVLTAALRLQVDDVRQIAVCGDTENDILAGRRAGAAVLAGVLTGAHDQARLQAAGATHILPSIADLPDLLLGLTAPAPS